MFLIKREYEDHDGHYDHYKTFGIQIKQINISNITSDEKAANLHTIDSLYEELMSDVNDMDNSSNL